MAERHVEVKDTYGVQCGDKWLVVDGLKSVKRGQVFRLWDEVEKNPVCDVYGKTDFLAVSDPYWSDTHSTWMIDIDLTEYSDIVN